MKKRLIILFLFFVTLTIHAQSEQEYLISLATKTYSISEIREDILQIKDAYEEVHPALYRFVTKEKLDSLFKVTIQSVKEPLTYAEFYRLVTPLVTIVRCGHTEISLSNNYRSYTNNALPRFPFEVSCINNKLYILKNYSNDTSITIGSEIKTINGVSSEKITSTLLPTFSSDSYINTPRKHILRLLFRETLGLYYGNPDEYTVEFISLDNKYLKRSIKGLKEKDILYYKKIHYLMNSISPFSLKIDRESKIATLKILTFLQNKVVNETYNIYNFLDSTFKQIKKIKLNI